MLLFAPECQVKSTVEYWIPALAGMTKKAGTDSTERGLINKPHIDICQVANYNLYVTNNHLGGIIKQQRVSLSMTLHELASASGVSASHLGRIERGERFPSARILQRIAKPLDFEEDELFTLAGYLSPQGPVIAEKSPVYGSNRLDPYVARALAQELVETQRAVIGILAILKSLGKNISKEGS